VAREDWYILDAAKRYSKEVNYNKEKQEYFKAGVRWTIQRLMKDVIGDTGPYNIDSGTKAYLRTLDLKSVKKFCEQAMEFCPDPERPSNDQR